MLLKSYLWNLHILIQDFDSIFLSSPLSFLFYFSSKFLFVYFLLVCFILLNTKEGNSLQQEETSQWRISEATG